MSTNLKVLITRRQFQDQISRLGEVADVTVLDRPEPPTRDELKKAVLGCSGIFAHITDLVDGEIMDIAGKNLKVIAEFGVGYDNVDVRACNANGVLLTITPDGVRRPVAASVMTFILALSHKLTIKDTLIRQGRWAEKSDYMGMGITGRTLGVIGLGNPEHAVLLP